MKMKTVSKINQLVIRIRQRRMSLRCIIHGHNYILERNFNDSLPINLYKCSNCGIINIKAGDHAYDDVIEIQRNRSNEIVTLVFGTVIWAYLIRIVQTIIYSL